MEGREERNEFLVTASTVSQCSLFCWMLRFVSVVTTLSTQPQVVAVTPIMTPSPSSAVDSVTSVRTGNHSGISATGDGTDNNSGVSGKEFVIHLR